MSGGNYNYSLIDKNDSQSYLLPMPLMTNLDDDAVKGWIHRRGIPKNRHNVNVIMEAAGISPGDQETFLNVSKGLSINDAYWIVNIDDKTHYDEVSLYDHNTSGWLGVVAYTGQYNPSNNQDGKMSTEWTTNGAFAKAWRNIDGSLCLYKAGTEETLGGHEPYSEYFSSQLANVLGLDAVSYGLDEWKGKLASTCKLMNSKDISLVSFNDATSFTNRYPDNLALALMFNEDVFHGLRTMIAFDALIANHDRHGGNYGFKRQP